MSALATHSPTVTVKVGLIEDARTMSRLSPVARMERPSRVPRKRTSSPPASKVTAPERRIALQLPPMPVSRKRVKMVSCFRSA